MTLKEASIGGLSNPDNRVIVKEVNNKLIVSSPGPRGPRGNTILNGRGAPAKNLGLIGDFYFDLDTTRLYGPKVESSTWNGVESFILNKPTGDYAITLSWELPQVLHDEIENYYYIELNHNLNFYPNATVLDSAGDIWVTGIIYNSTNKLTLTMAQPFSGTAYLS